MRKRAPAKRKNTSGLFTALPVFRILLYVLLLLFLALSLLTVFYVIFFQVVVAGELTENTPVPKAAVRIEQPGTGGRQSIELVNPGIVFHT